MLGLKSDNLLYIVFWMCSIKCLIVAVYQYVLLFNQHLVQTYSIYGNNIVNIFKKGHSCISVSLEVCFQSMSEIK